MLCGGNGYNNFDFCFDVDRGKMTRYNVDIRMKVINIAGGRCYEKNRYLGSTRGIAWHILLVQQLI